MLMLNYPSKKVLREHIGKPLNFEETSVFGPEYVRDGRVTGSNRPFIAGRKMYGPREFFANVTMRDGLIEKVD